jgi:hypothetical protein
MKNWNSINIMLLGIEITIIGGITVLDNNTNIHGLEYILLFLGLIITISGGIKSTNK